MNSRCLLPLVLMLGSTCLVRAEEPTSSSEAAEAPSGKTSTAATSSPTSAPSADAEPAPEAGPAATVPADDPDGEDLDRFWASGEYLFWWMRGAHVPPLVTTSPAGTPQASAGILGMNGTRILVGNEDVNEEGRSGGRFFVGAWLDDKQTYAVEASFFFLQERDTHLGANSPSGTTILARPFLNTTTGGPDARLVAFPGDLAGNVVADVSSPGLLGAEINLRESLGKTERWRLSALLGYRFFQLRDRLDVSQTSTAIGTTDTVFGLAQNGTITFHDSFHTKNDFSGGDFGVVAEWGGPRLSVDLTAKLAVGFNHEVVDVNGSNVITEPGQAAVTSAGGFLAVPSQIGHFTHNDVAVIPELGLNLGYQVTDHIRVFGGYTFLLWSQAVRAGNQVNLNINPSELPPGATPGAQNFSMQKSSLWVQGIEAGVGFSY